uniref:Uncharacterized protein n=1 Tax=Oryza meridionalis TaxID=40149 RepID=A0A0E0E9W0_9ORYZ
MTKHGSSSFGGALSLCKVILMILALICTLHTASVQGGRAAVAAIGGGGKGSVLDPTYTPPTTPGGSYTGRGCHGPYRCPPGAGSP